MQHFPCRFTVPKNSPATRRAFASLGAVSMPSIADALITLTATVQKLRGNLALLAERVANLAQRISALERDTPRRFTVTLTNVAVGGTDVPVVWAVPLVAQDYTPLCTFQGGDNALTVLRAGLVPGSKDENGCTIRVINTGASVIPLVGLDVIGVRP